jgi:hypothetical protein
MCGLGKHLLVFQDVNTEFHPSHFRKIHAVPDGLFIAFLPLWSTRAGAPAIG